MWKIDLKKGQNIWFTSDTHYNHSNICRGTTKWVGNLDKYTRNFPTIDIMNTTIVDNINTLIVEDDILIHLGDWSLGGFDSIREFRKRIICKNVYLVLGNHDPHIENNKENIQELFVDVVHYTRLEVNTYCHHAKFPSRKLEFVLSHFPICSWHGMNKDVMHLFGHVHLDEFNKIMRGKSMDVGVDGNYLYPYRMNQIIQNLHSRPNATTVIPSDHHATEIR